MSKIFMGDFETTVYAGQKDTEVWASAVVELYTEDVVIFHSIEDTFDYLSSQGTNVTIYYHNLKFDGAFWLDFLIKKMNFKQAYNEVNGVVSWVENRFMENRTFKYLISDRGIWYDIVIKYRGTLIQIRDSLKLLPFSVERIGQSFGTKHKKLNMEYTGYRYAGCEITEEEQRYIANDVLVVKEALEILFDEGHTKTTIGSCCMAEFKRILGKDEYATFFPNVYDLQIDPTVYKYRTAGEYILKSYRGGWCYLVEDKANKVYHNGVTADVNSLYPSMMSSASGNRYPVGKPCFWSGNFIPDQAIGENKYFFIRIRTRFRIKEGYLPFIQIKGNLYYKSTESLKTSDIRDQKTGKYFRYYEDYNGCLQPAKVDLTLTMTDWYLINEHYVLEELEILDGCWFFSETCDNLFDRYMEKYKKIKMTSKGAKRELAKLFLNNLYGKMATTTNSSFKIAYEDVDSTINYRFQTEFDKKPGYIPVGSAITSYARNFTIRTAQKNYHGPDKPGFIYADTDSIHCDLDPDDLVGVPVHPTEFCHWKLESCWDDGLFVRQKTYIEHIVKEDMETIEDPYYNIKCAGMPGNCKDMFLASMTGEWEDGKYEGEELEFVKVKRELTDFKRGLTIPGKLMPRRIPGGVLLVPTTFEMR